jgi:hypothetical protein
MFALIIHILRFPVQLTHWKAGHLLIFSFKWRDPQSRDYCIPIPSEQFHNQPETNERSDRLTFRPPPTCHLLLPPSQISPPRRSFYSSGPGSLRPIHSALPATQRLSRPCQMQDSRRPSLVSCHLHLVQGLARPTRLASSQKSKGWKF